MTQSKALAFLMILGTMSGAFAGTPATTLPSGKLDKAVETKEASIYDKIWGALVLYKNKENPVIQEFKLRGRQQDEWFYFDGSGGSDEDWVVRRTRIGFEAKMFQEFTIHSEAVLDPQNPNPLYTKLTAAYIKWSPSKQFNLIVGKQGVNFTLDGATSSTALITIDRSNLANNIWFTEEYVPGITVTGELGKWLYNVGYFTSGKASPEFGDFNAGSFGLVSIGYNFAEALGVDKAVLRGDFVYQDEDPNNSKGDPSPFTRNEEIIGSLNFQLEDGRFDLGADLAASKGYGSQPNLLGLQFMPSYYLNASKTLQAVFRYTFIESDGKNGIRFARYENRIAGGRCDRYNEFYAGLNWYLYGHKLKFQTGVQYATASDGADDGGDYHGWGVTTGVRVSW